MNNNSFWKWAAVLWLMSAAVLAQAQSETSTAPQAVELINTPQHQRETRLAAELRCLVCQNQNIADSNADLAVDLRRQIHEQVVAGKSDREILDYMTARYGDFVLYRPPVKVTTVLLWFGPLLMLALGALLAWRMVRARARAASERMLNEGEHQRAVQLLSGE